MPCGLFLTSNPYCPLSVIFSDFSIYMNCQPQIKHPIHPYAYWVHTHSAGTVISAYKVVTKSKTIGPKAIEIARWHSKWPQPVWLDESENRTIIYPGNTVAGSCTYYNKSNQSITWGSSFTANEMCNIFIYYYVDPSYGESISNELSCVNERLRSVRNFFPPNFNQLPNVNPVCHLYYKIGLWNCPFQ